MPQSENLAPNPSLTTTQEGFPKGLTYLETEVQPRHGRNHNFARGEDTRGGAPAGRSSGRHAVCLFFECKSTNMNTLLVLWRCEERKIKSHSWNSQGSEEQFSEKRTCQSAEVNKRLLAGLGELLRSVTSSLPARGEEGVRDQRAQSHRRAKRKAERDNSLLGGLQRLLDRMSKPTFSGDPLVRLKQFIGAAEKDSTFE